MTASAIDVETVREALHDVIDPELGYNIVDLGLIYDLAIEDGVLKVTMTMTTPGCPAQDYIQDGVFRRAMQVEGIDDVDIKLVWEPRWSVQRMSAIAKKHFGIAEQKP